MIYLSICYSCFIFYFFQAEDGIRDFHVTGVQTCALPITGSGLHARKIEQHRGVRRVLVQRLLVDGDRVVPPLLVRRWDRGEERLPRRHLERPSGEAADGEHDGVLLLRYRAALHRRLADEHERSCARVDVLAVEGEPDAAPDDDVDLLVARALDVLLHDPAADAFAGVRVCSEGADVEAATDGPPDEAVLDRDLFEVVERRDVDRQASASSKRGSSRTAAKSSSVRAWSRNGGNDATACRRLSNTSSPLSPARTAKQARL